MNPEQFLQSIYLGDRACKAVHIESLRRQIAIQVDVISLLNPGTKTWWFFSEADIPNGWLVFGDVRAVRFEPAGPVPNDLINSISVKLLDPCEDSPKYLFELSIDSVDSIGIHTEVLLQIEASSLHIEDPKGQVSSSF